MSSPDFATFVGAMIADHGTWLGSHPSPTGTQFFDHYVGDAPSPGLLWRYEAWRFEHGYTRVRPWNGSEALGRAASADIPFPGRVLPWVTPESAAGPALDSRLAETRTTAQLQADFSSLNQLGAEILQHWNAVRSHSPGDFEISQEDTALYSIRLWGFTKWASILKNRWMGIPVFPIPIVYDADGVPLSDIEYMDWANRWHEIWHGFRPDDQPNCTQMTSVATNNPFAPAVSTFGQFCTRNDLTDEFLVFHRSLLDTYDRWRQRAGMPKVQRWKPPELHFHSTTINGNAVPEVELSEDPAIQYNQIKDRVQHYNTPLDLAAFEQGALHSAGHGAAESDDIADPNSNNYSVRFFGWHRWADYLWEVRQPRFDSFGPVASDGTSIRGILTWVQPVVSPDRVEPSNALTGLAADGRGSIWVKFRVRTETWGRPINMSLTAQVYRDSSDMTPVPGLDATTISINSVAQGVDSAPTEVHFDGLDGDGDGAFASETLPGGAIGFKNGRIRITATLAPVGNIPTSFASGNDQFSHQEQIEVVLVKESRPPTVGVLFNKSSFSLDEVTLNAGGANSSPFANAFFVVLQDPPEPPPALAPTSIFADPASTAVSGIFADTSHAPTVQVVDDAGNPVSWFSVVLTDVFKESPALDDNVSQRVLFRYLAVFDVPAMTALLPNAGDIEYARLQMTARDRAGNTVQDVLSPRIKLFRDANPYMIDILGDNPGWLSIDTRVFSLRQNEVKFNHSVASSGSPNQYIADVIAEFNAGTQNFDAIPADQGQAQLELAPQVNGQYVYNFTLARVRVRTTTPVPDVRVFFRLFTTALSNLSFNTVNYPSSNSGNPKPMLGKASPANEIVSIPFFADPRVETRDTMPGAGAMTAQPDVPNVQALPVSPPGAETTRYFGAYLDINSDTPRYPQAPVGNGPFPTSQCMSIRNILRGQHECMVAEIQFSGDPTDPNSNPGTSDNLAQRNLLILETANPGHRITHTVQHSFDIVLPNRKERDTAREEVRREKRASFWRLRAKPASVASHVADVTSQPAVAEMQPAFVAAGAMAAEGFVGTHATVRAGFDELMFLWNNLPHDSMVEIYLPSIDVDYIRLLRSARHAPDTVRVLDEHTLSLKPEGVSYLPVPNIGRERIAGLLTITLPDSIKAGAVYSVDVLQIRPATGSVVGAFQVMIPVSKALSLYEREARLLEIFEERLATTPKDSRWHPILARQVEQFRVRARALAEEAVEECGPPPGEDRGEPLRVILERVKVLDPHGPLVHGSGRLRLVAQVNTGEEGVIQQTTLPDTGEFIIDTTGEEPVVELNREIFRGRVRDELTVEIWSGEEEAIECHYHREFKGQPEALVGEYQPSDEPTDPENVGDWQLWYRVEPV